MSETRQIELRRCLDTAKVEAAQIADHAKALEDVVIASAG